MRDGCDDCKCVSCKCDTCDPQKKLPCFLIKLGRAYGAYYLSGGEVTEQDSAVLEAINEHDAGKKYFMMRSIGKPESQEPSKNEEDDYRQIGSCRITYN